jgi:hypothetical protein
VSVKLQHSEPLGLYQQMKKSDRLARNNLLNLPQPGKLTEGHANTKVRT